MDELEMLLQAIINISNECTDVQTQKRLDDLYDRTVDGIASIKKAKSWGMKIDEISGYVPQ